MARWQVLHPLSFLGLLIILADIIIPLPSDNTLAYVLLPKPKSLAPLTAPSDFLPFPQLLPDLSMVDIKVLPAFFTSEFDVVSEE